MIGFALVLALVSLSGQGSESDDPARALNDSCPIAKERIDGRTFARYSGRSVGFCCPGCVKMFEAWSENRKLAFLEATSTAHEAGRAVAETAAEKVSSEWTEPYSLDTCAVLGTKLGSKGEPVVKLHNGREVRFCCAGCLPRFEADPVSFLEKVDAQMIVDQRPIYPLDTCLVTDVPLTVGGKDVGVDVVYGNRLFRVRDVSARQRLLTDPRSYAAALDEAVVTKQRKSYPLEVCIVAGSELGSMGEPSELIVAGRLFRFCCGGCEPEVIQSPRSYIKKIDDARASDQDLDGVSGGDELRQEKRPAGRQSNGMRGSTERGRTHEHRDTDRMPRPGGF